MPSTRNPKCAPDGGNCSAKEARFLGMKLPKQQQMTLPSILAKKKKPAEPTTAVLEAGAMPQPKYGRNNRPIDGLPQKTFETQAEADAKNKPTIVGQLKKLAMPRKR